MIDEEVGKVQSSLKRSSCHDLRITPRRISARSLDDPDGMGADAEHETINDIESQKNSVELEYNKDIKQCLELYKRSALSLAERQRREAESAVQYWKQKFEEIQRYYDSQVNSSIKISEILADCDNIEGAASIREAAAANSSSPIAVDCLEHFKKHMSLMTERHNNEFAELKVHMSSYIASLQQEAQEAEMLIDSPCT